ncbi:hypothetical protein SRHO_G00092210 [Serrasalmus rhombeus]
MLQVWMYCRCRYPRKQYPPRSKLQTFDRPEGHQSHPEKGVTHMRRNSRSSSADHYVSDTGAPVFLAVAVSQQRQSCLLQTRRSGSS